MFNVPLPSFVTSFSSARLTSRAANPFASLTNRATCSALPPKPDPKDPKDDKDPKDPKDDKDPKVPKDGKDAKVSKREMRRRIIQSDTFNRMGFKETRKSAESMMSEEFTSDLVKELLASGNSITRGNVTINLAKDYGFCWGVERAVAMAYQTRSQFPDKRIFITNEIIHNPSVNNRLRDMGIFFVPQDENMAKDLSEIQKNDVVVLPAFGATLEEMSYLNGVGSEIVDTTCPWVSKVWGTLDHHQKKNCTSIIHGKWRHEETIATASFAETYLIVLNLEEAKYVSEYILYGGDKQEFLRKFENAMSSDFDPDLHLEAIGVANQTTMLKSETTDIGKLFEQTMLVKYGATQLNDRFLAFDTICDATQERQDAMFDMLGDEKRKPDIMLVVGGFNSSNTSHLQEIAEHAGVTSYWVDQPECVGPGNSIRYRLADGTELVKDNWLSKEHVTIGLTSGASTPDKVVDDVLERVFMISKLSSEE